MSKGKVDLARAIIDKYVDIALKNNVSYSKKELGRILRMENPDLFKSDEEGRKFIRDVCGSSGSRSARDTDVFAEKFALIAGQIKECNIETFIFPTAYKKTLAIADLHSRFMDRECFKIAVDRGIKEGCDSVLILGDFLDFYMESKFDKFFSVAKFWEEREWAQDMLKILQDTFGYVVLKKGNHDIRREQKLGSLAVSTHPEIADLVSYNDFVMFDGSNIQIVEDYNIIQYGKLFCIHGHEIQGGGIHVAYNRLQKAHESILSAHSHRAQSFSATTISGEPIGSWSLGCLADTHPQYNPVNQYSNGFAILEKDSDGYFNVDNKRILNGRIFNA